MIRLVLYRSFQITCVNRLKLGVRSEVSLKYLNTYLAITLDTIDKYTINIISTITIVIKEANFVFTCIHLVEWLVSAVRCEG